MLSCLFHPTFHISLFGHFMQVTTNEPPKRLLEDFLVIVTNFDSQMSVWENQNTINIPPEEGEEVETNVIFAVYVFQEDFNIIGEPRSAFLYRDSCVIRTYSLLFPFLCECFSNLSLPFCFLSYLKHSV